MQSIDQRLKLYNGIGPGFDFLRIVLAISIVAFHCWQNLGYRDLAIRTPLWFAEDAFVPMFFALSGFLVTGSAMRLSLKNFLINRALRILPALTVDVLVCALVIGPMMTKVPLGQYYSGSEFFKYFLNVTGWIHYTLPGVFKDCITDKVNGALWTVPFEMFCYFLMSLLILSRWVRYPLGVVAFIGVILVARFTLSHFGSGVGGDAYSPIPFSNLDASLSFAFNSTGTRPLIAFLFGILFFQLRHIIPYSWPLFITCTVACAATAFGHDRTFVTHVLSNSYALLLPLVYMTCFLGVTKIPAPHFFHSGDYSYGIYLYHDPFLQVIISLLPAALWHSLFGAPILFLLGLPVVLIVAACSWHFVEKPILGLRKRFSFVARMRQVASQTDLSVAPPLAAELGSPAQILDVNAAQGATHGHAP